MKITSWNVNGIRSIKNYHPFNRQSPAEMLNSLESSIVCFQEIKATVHSLPAEFIDIPGYHSFYALSNRAYSGVATFVRKDIQVLACELGFTNKTDSLGHMEELYDAFGENELKELDSEGRVVITDHGLFVLFNVYFPAYSESTDRLEFKIKFHRALQIRVDSFIKRGRSVIVAGDINVCHREIDHCDPQLIVKERNLTCFEDNLVGRWLDKWLVKTMIDSFRYFHPQRMFAFTCWNTLLNARASNYGTRIDYCLVSKDLETILVDAEILPSIMGSDHCPINLTLSNDISLKIKTHENVKPPRGCTYYWNSFGGKQPKIASFFTKIQRVSNSDNRVIKKSTLSAKSVSNCKIKECKNSGNSKMVNDWKEVMKPTNIPKCAHGILCKSARSQKKESLGKIYYTCAIDTNSKSENTKCKFFQWKERKL